MGVYQNNMETIQVLSSDSDIEMLMKQTERADESAYCLDYEVAVTDIDQELFYEEVTCKKKCYGTME